MGLFSAQDIADMVEALGDGKTMAYTPAEGGDATNVEVIFFNEFQVSELFGNEVANRGPMVMVLESALIGTVKGGTLVDGSTTYNLLNPQPDGEGWLEIGMSIDAS